MALISCRECGREVSSRALACPRCGFPRPGLRPKHAFLAGAVGFSILVLILLLMTAARYTILD